MDESQSNLIQKLDTSEAGVYIAKLNCRVTLERGQQIRDHLESTICKISPNSVVLILGSEFDFVSIPSDEAMNKMGWVRDEVEK